MPNWCYNYVTVTHKDADKITELAKTIDEGTTFEHFLPVPKELIEPTDPDFAAKGFTTMGNAEYSWRVDNWGTKWDICRPEIHARHAEMLDLYFETAWSPPTGIFEAMKEQGYVIQAEYWEEGGFFVGRWSDGEDECFKPEDAPPELSHLVAHTRNEDEDEEAA
jgi:hypothetical protein